MRGVARLTMIALATASAGAMAVGREQAPPDPLAGLVAEAPTDCVSLAELRSASSTIVDGRILYRVSNRLIYVNDPGASCGLRKDAGLVTRSSGARLCRGDIIDQRDFQTGMSYGSCALGAFTPYRRPR